MKIKKFPESIVFFTLFIQMTCNVHFLTGQNDTSIINTFIQKTDISAQWFLAFTYDISDNENYFNLKRGYFTIKTDLSPTISVRYTQDITFDREGQDAGNIEFRMKYLYMKFKPFKNGFLKDIYTEIGMVHRPWLDFEQKINDYRVQGTMYLERYGIFNSADLGLTLVGLFGGELDKTLQKEIGSHYPGKYGSYSFGIFNGPGYHDNELNNNKLFESRISIRPFPNVIPGLQFSYTCSLGKANSENNLLKFNMHLIYLSYESQHYTFTGQYYRGKGDSFGNYYSGELPYHNEGYSVFGEVWVPLTHFSVVSRYDYFLSKQAPDYQRNGYYIGTAYRFLNNKLLVYFSRDFYPEGKRDLFETVLEIAF